MTEQIAQQILQYNPYFNKGFGDGYLNTKGVYQSGTEQVLFPNDSLGDYFYLRQLQPTRIVNRPVDKIVDCAASFAIQSNGVLVAYIRKADSTILISNLISTLSFLSIAVTSVTMQPEVVILQELQGLDPETIAQTIANMDKSVTLISIAFQYYLPLPLVDLNCLPNPCNSCSGSTI